MFLKINSFFRNRKPLMVALFEFILVLGFGWGVSLWVPITMFEFGLLLIVFMLVYGYLKQGPRG